MARSDRSAGGVMMAAGVPVWRRTLFGAVVTVVEFERASVFEVFAFEAGRVVSRGRCSTFAAALRRALDGSPDHV
ncbi:hypothetical protein [Mycobacterium colombiense]|uniref:hypothetical protein n=1 Tax=Mycobacterium colombiense TaxID=339268 RepID=UPI00021B241D|nr:hypothetical protein [Mycobacterium colombiense]